MSQRSATKSGIVFALVMILSFLISTSRTAHVATVSDSDSDTASARQAFDQEAKLAELRTKIAGRENEPAEAVFKNIQFLKGVPAGRLLAVMKIGYSRSLGVLLRLPQPQIQTADQMERFSELPPRRRDAETQRKQKNN